MEKRIKKLENVAFIMIIPLLLLLPFFEGNLRPSVSDYVYSSVSLLFAVILTFSATMLMVNGCNSDLHTRNKWYAFIQGGLLIAIVLTPHLDYPVLHYICAGAFFIGSMFEMVFWSSVKYRIVMFVFTGLILLGLAGHFIFNFYSLYWAEIIGLTPIVINKLGENNGKLD